MKKQKTGIHFVLCIRNSDCKDLEPRKIYQVIEGSGAEEEGLIRVMDESGEDYPYELVGVLRLSMSPIQDIITS